MPEVSSQYIDNSEMRSPPLNAERKSGNLCLEFVYMYMDLVCWAPATAGKVERKGEKKERNER